MLREKSRGDRVLPVSFVRVPGWRVRALEVDYLMTGEYTVEEIQHQDNSNPKHNLKRDVLFLDDFFVEATARRGIEVFGFVFQGLGS